VTARPALALLFLAACTHPSPAVTEQPDGVDGGGAVGDAGAETPDPAPVTPAPDASAIDLPADGGIAALLSGAVPAASLPEVATEPGQGLDHELRRRLTTREVVAGDDEARKAFGEEVSVSVAVKTMSATRPMADAERVAASLRPRLRACYRQGLTVDPAMAGSLVIAVKVGANGDVEDARAAQNVGLSPAVAACIARGYKNATFDPPAGGAGATLSVTLTFASGS
jgi:hypothetical protein